ncbi:MAG TPA: hypothetical protein ENJ56_07275 [Anaerolineae bacterium]|nr:hypothetical protein [Anaerolineae bacterium]
MLDLYVYSIKIAGNDLAALSLLPPETVHSHGLPSEAVLGEVNPNQPEMTTGGFTANGAFLDLLSTIIVKHAPDLPSLQKQAAKVDNGAIYVVDHRNINQGKKPPYEDVIGWFTMRDGQFVADSWNNNPQYKLLSNNGPIQLEAILEEKLLEAVRAISNNQDKDNYYPVHPKYPH